MPDASADDAAVAPAAANSAATQVDICICTFQRPSLRRTLESLIALDGGVRFRVIVADNDDTPSARELVAQAQDELGLSITYRHAPARNISVARNACLDAVEAEFMAFIDDDEIAPPHWLRLLFEEAQASGADVVFGPVKAVYGSDAPAWVVTGDFHSFQPVIGAGGEIETGYSSNVLMRRSAVGALRFDPALGRAGGEDTFFFAQMHEAGARLGFCPGAMVEEPTAPARANLSWLTRRAFRSGQTHARLLRSRGQGALAITAGALPKALYCGFWVIGSLYSPVRWRKNVIRGALHVGVLARAWGLADLEIYGR